MAGYAAGLALAQGAGAALRVSCATPVLGPLGGVLGVGLASALAGQAAAKATAVRRDGARAALLAPGALLRGVAPRDLLIDAALGAALFRAGGGRFRAAMPSDLVRPGAAAAGSVPADGAGYASEGARRELLRMFRRGGCHHCGRTRGPVVGDHMPPNKHAAEAARAAKARLLGPALRVPGVRRALSALGVPVGAPRQRFFPQCAPCSQRQAAAVRNGRRALAFHSLFHRGGRGTAWHLSGVVVGLRHYGEEARAARCW
jgi:hypothetical protein